MAFQYFHEHSVRVSLEIVCMLFLSKKTQNCCSSVQKRAGNTAGGALTGLHRDRPTRVSVAQYSIVTKVFEHRRS